MGAFDNLKDKAQDAFSNQDLQEKAKQYAEEHNITVEEAKNRLMNKGGSDEGDKDEDTDNN